jgi:hypothetical protein
MSEKNYLSYVGFEILTMVVMKRAMLVILVSSPVGSYQSRGQAKGN